MKVRTYEVLTRAVEEGAQLGVQRAFKHSDAPTREVIANAVVDAVMAAVLEVFDFAEAGNVYSSALTINDELEATRAECPTLDALEGEKCCEKPAAR